MTRRIFLGHDAREQAAYDVAEFSLRRRASVPLEITPISRHTVLHTRLVEYRDSGLWCPISRAPMSTDFAIARFAVPSLARTGWALFADCDILVLSDIEQLFALADPRYAVMVVQHAQTPQEKKKMDGQIQTTYPRKNWSSVILWNCDHPAHERLTPWALRTWTGRRLHAFDWLDDEEIGALPLDWNFLVDVNTVEQIDGRIPKLLHYTLGGPWFDRPCSFAAEWQQEHLGLEITRATHSLA
jgi:lipopolysaccharide biosynthesis glycosyltransferase